MTRRPKTPWPVLSPQRPHLSYTLLGILTIGGCGQPTTFTELPVPVAEDVRATDAGKQNSDSLAEQPQTTNTDDDLRPSGDDDAIPTLDELFPGGILLPPEELVSGNAEQVEDDDLLQRRRELFSFGDDSRSPLVDYLFVLDNSCSVDPIGAKLSSGFLSLVGSAILPSKSKLAVMSTMIADEDNLFTTGVGINRYEGIDAEPGFLDFVDRASIAAYRSLNTAYSSEWPLQGCENGWFSPGELAPEGHFCLQAATQSSNSCLGAEAGIQAFEQLLLKKQQTGDAAFREGALVNVIFVSDTHDPGTNIDSLKASIPAYEELYELAFDTNTLNGIRFHSLAPSEPCTTEGLHDFSYYDLSDASGGLKADPCNLNNYENFLADMVDVSAQTMEPRFTLSRSPDSILAIFVDGVEITDYKLIGSQTVEIPSLDPTKPHSIEVIYNYL